MKPDTQAALDNVLANNLTPHDLYESGFIDGHELLSKISLIKITAATGYVRMVTQSVLNNRARASILPKLLDTVTILQEAVLVLRYIEPADEVRARALFKISMPLVQRVVELRKKMNKLWEAREQASVPELRAACNSIASQLQGLADELGDEAASRLSDGGYYAAMDSRGLLGSEVKP